MNPTDPESRGWSFAIETNPRNAPDPAPEPPPEPAPEPPPMSRPFDLDVPTGEDWGTAFFSEEWNRRDGWDGFAWVTLNDGQEWAFPSVDVALMVEFPAISDALASYLNPPPMPPQPPVPATFAEIDADATRAYIAAFQERSDRFRALVVALLRANYHLDPLSLGTLVTGQDPDKLVVDLCWRWLDDVGDACQGMGPESVALVKSRGVPISIN